jgi:hypothetical protein
MQENENISTINNEREIEEDGNSGQITLQTDQKVEKREGGGISENMCSAMPCALCCYLTYSFFLLL